MLLLLCINFGFIKDFWVKLKSDVMRFLLELEFYRNDKLTTENIL